MALYDPKKDYLPPDRSVPFRESTVGKLVPKGVFENRVTEFNKSTKGAMDQRTTGGSGNTGASQTGAAVQSGTGAEPIKPQIDAKTMMFEQSKADGLDFPEAYPGTASVVRLGDTSSQTQADMLNKQASSFDPALAPRSQESTRIGDVAPKVGAGAFSVAGTGQSTEDRVADLNAGTAALQDLRDYKLKRGAYEQEDRPVTVIGGYKSYQDDLAAYQSGDVRSEGYNRIRNERMQLKSQIDDATRGVRSSKAKASIVGSILGNYSEQQKSRMEVEADTAQQGMAAQASAYKAQQEAMSDAAKLGFDQQKFAAEFGLNRADLERKRMADEALQQDRTARLGLDVQKFSQQSGIDEARYGTGGLEQQKLLMQATEAGARQGTAQQNTAVDKIKVAKDILGGATGEIDPELREQLLRSLGIDFSK